MTATTTIPALPASTAGREIQRRAKWLSDCGRQRGWIHRLLIIIGAALSAVGKGTNSDAGSRSASSPNSTKSATLSPTAPAKPQAAAKVLATFSGSGIENTPKFAVRGTWKLEWRYDCTSFGFKGNFAILTDGGNDPSGADVNELGKTGHGATYAYGDGGRHYLAIDSECAWRVKVVGTH
ncbi:MAG TPA: hypothetical protein VFI65_15825 [Streptosporangiaceae bacterium]|nr:hypothetical protein [Streptosporangiaceae bacterium]